MKQVLFCVDQSFLKDLIKINFRHSKFIQPIVAESFEEAVGLFNLTTDIKLVITQTIVKDYPAAKELAALIENEREDSELIILGSDPKIEGNYEVRPLNKVRDLFDELRRKYGGNEDEDTSKEICVSMPAHLFLHFKALPFDIFLKVQQGEEAKYIKRFNASEPLDQAAVSKYMSRGVTDFYLEKNCLKDFSKLLINQMEERLYEASEGNDHLLAEGEVFTSLQDMVKSLGLKPQVVRLCEVSMQNVQRRLSEEGPFKSFLENLKVNPRLNFHFAFVQMTSLLCSQYVEHTDWPKKQKDDLIDKLVFSSFFCDMNLNNDEMLMVRNEKDLKKFTPAQREMILQHAQKNAAIILQYPGAPLEVDKIIMQHHGSPTGTGLSEMPGAGINLAAQILFYTQDLSLRILQAQGRSLKDILSEFLLDFEASPSPEIISKMLKSFV